MATANSLAVAIERLRAAKLVEAVKNIKPPIETNEPIVPFPLADFVRLYYAAAKKDVYIEYMNGAKLLYNWLSPLSPPDIPAHELANCEIVASKCGSYEMELLAKIIHTTPGTILWILMN